MVGCGMMKLEIANGSCVVSHECHAQENHIADFRTVLCDQISKLRKMNGRCYRECLKEMKFECRRTYLKCSTVQFEDIMKIILEFIHVEVPLFCYKLISCTTLLTFHLLFQVKTVGLMHMA